MPAVQETVEQVRRIDVDQYKYGFETDDRIREGPEGPVGRHRPLHFGQEERAGMDAGVAARSLSALAHHARADLGARRLSEDRLSGRTIITRRRRRTALKSLDEVDPEILKTYEKLGIPLREQEILARRRAARRRKRARASRWTPCSTPVSVATTFKEELKKAGVIFMPISEAIREHPELVKKYLGSVVPTSDNFFATLNSAVFSDGSFVYVPPGVRCPMELSTYFRINEKNTGQFERTLIIADKGAYVSYLEGCTAPMRDENQLHAAVVELVALDDAEIKYSTVQNWYPGRRRRQGRHLQLRHQARRLPRRALEDFLDAGRDRLGDHLEISELHPARRQFARRVLFDRDLERPPAGRQRHQDAASRQEHDQPHHLQGHRGRTNPTTPIAAW